MFSDKPTIPAYAMSPIQMFVLADICQADADRPIFQSGWRSSATIARLNANALRAQARADLRAYGVRL